MAEPPPGLTVRRLFDAPREAVWREWTEPERFAAWFGGRDTEVPLATLTMDVRPGGRWRATTFSDRNPRGTQWDGEYLEVVPHERLVLTMSDRPGEDAYELLTIVLRDAGDGRTEMHLEQRGQLPPSDYERARTGWGTFFDRMAERLARAAE